MKRIILKLENGFQLGEGVSKIVSYNGLSIVLFKFNSEYFAFENMCTHEDEPLSKGKIDDYEIECPKHGAKFDIRTGEVRSLPAVKPLKIFDVTVANNEIIIYLPING